MTSKDELILIWHNSKQIFVPKKRIIEKILKENAKRYVAIWNKYSNCYHMEFIGNLNIILENIEDIGTIQIYQDGEVRLHLKCKHYEEAKSIYFTANEDEILILKNVM